MNAHLGLCGQAMTRLQESFSAWDEIKDRVSTIGAVFSGASFGDFGVIMDERAAIARREGRCSCIRSVELGYRIHSP